jgi:hypothetical protein
MLQRHLNNSAKSPPMAGRSYELQTSLENCIRKDEHESNVPGEEPFFKKVGIICEATTQSLMGRTESERCGGEVA